MIKFLALGESDQILIGLGITDANIEQLRLGRPIRVELQPLLQDLTQYRRTNGTPSAELVQVAQRLRGLITIIYGKDEFAIEAMLRDNGLITEGTKTQLDPKLEALRPKVAPKEAATKTKRRRK